MSNSPYAVEYVYPTTIAEAVEILAAWNGEARLIAGGTDLMLELTKKKIQPRCLVSVEQVQGLKEIVVEENFVVIGAAVTFAEIKDHDYIKRHLWALAEAARSVGSLAIQNQATLAGNIVNAMPAADGAIAAVALDAEACIVDKEGTKWQLVESLFLGPGKSSVNPTAQILTHLRFPRRREHLRGTGWCRLARRPSLTLPILNCAVDLSLRNGQTIEQAHIALGPVASRPFRARRAEQFLEGHTITHDVLKQAAEIARDECHPRGNVLRASREYRLATIPTLVETALQQSVSRALTL